MALQDLPKKVDSDWIETYQELLTPNAYTALAPYIAGLGGPPALDLAEPEHVDYNRNLLVRRTAGWHGTRGGGGGYTADR